MNVGDKVIITPRFNDPFIGVVTKVSPSGQFTVGDRGGRFMPNGNAVRGTHYSRSRARLATEEDFAKVAHRAAFLALLKKVEELTRAATVTRCEGTSIANLTAMEVYMDAWIKELRA